MDQAPNSNVRPQNVYRAIPDFEEWMHAAVDESLFESLHGKVNLLAGSDKIRWAQDRILRASAFETGAVEDLYRGGVTFSVAMEIDGWQAELADVGDGAEHHFDDQLAAYVWVRDMPSGQGRSLTEAAIREVHTIATQSQSTYPVLTSLGIQNQSFVPGRYKQNENLVIGRDGTAASYCPVESVKPEMQRLVAAMRSDSFSDAHPIIQSAYVQWAVAHIHPFADGNGRIARVLASMPLFETYGVPLVVLADRKRGYLQALEAADQGDYQAMVDYVAARTSDTLAWLSDSLREIGPKKIRIRLFQRFLACSRLAASHLRLERRLLSGSGQNWTNMSRRRLRESSVWQSWLGSFLIQLAIRGLFPSRPSKASCTAASTVILN